MTDPSMPEGWPTEPAPREPAAAFRQAAAVWRQLYLSLVAEGFTKAEALALLGHAIAAASGGRGDSG